MVNYFRGSDYSSADETIYHESLGSFYDVPRHLLSLLSPIYENTLNFSWFKD